MIYKLRFQCGHDKFQWLAETDLAIIILTRFQNLSDWIKWFGCQEGKYTS